MTRRKQLIRAQALNLTPVVYVGAPVENNGLTLCVCQRGEMYAAQYVDGLGYRRMSGVLANAADFYNL